MRFSYTSTRYARCISTFPLKAPNRSTPRSGPVGLFTPRWGNKTSSPGLVVCSMGRSDFTVPPTLRVRSLGGTLLCISYWRLGLLHFLYTDQTLKSPLYYRRHDFEKQTIEKPMKSQKQNHQCPNDTVPTVPDLHFLVSHYKFLNCKQFKMSRFFSSLCSPVSFYHPEQSKI